jgi:hypothetical protein
MFSRSRVKSRRRPRPRLAVELLETRALPSGLTPVVLGPSAAATFPQAFPMHGVGGDETLLFGVQPAPAPEEPIGVHVASRLTGEPVADVTPPPGGWHTPLAIKIAEFQGQGANTRGTFLLLDAGNPPEQTGTRPAVIYRYSYSFSPQDGYHDALLATHVLPLAGPPGPGLPAGIVLPESMALLPGGDVAVTDTLGGAIWVAGPSLDDWRLAMIDPQFAPGFGVPEIDGIGRAPGGSTRPYRLLLPTIPGTPGPAAPGVHSIAYVPVTDEVYVIRTVSPGGLFGIPRSVLLDTRTPPFAKGAALQVVVPPTHGLSDLADGLDYDRFHPTSPWLYWQRAPSDVAGGGFNTLRRVNLFTGAVEVVAQSNILFDFTDEISALPPPGDSPFTYIASAMGQEENNPDINVLLGGVSSYVAPTLITVTGVSSGDDTPPSGFARAVRGGHAGHQSPVIPAAGGGQLCVSTIGDNSIERINPAGQVQPFVSSGLNGPVEIAFNANHDLFVANFSFSPFGAGTTISEITPSGKVSTFASGLSGPLGLAFGSDGFLYTSSPIAGTISKIAPDGTVSPFVTSGLAGPLGLAFDGAGNLYTANFFSGTVNKILPDGTVTTFATGFTQPTDVAFDAAGTLYVDSGASSISKVSSTGTVTPFVTAGLSTPVGMTFGSNGDLFVANETNGTVSKVTPDGVVSTFASGLNVPQDVAFFPVGSDPADTPARSGPATGAAGKAAVRGTAQRTTTVGTPAAAFVSSADFSSLAIPAAISWSASGWPIEPQGSAGGPQTVSPAAAHDRHSGPTPQPPRPAHPPAALAAPGTGRTPDSASDLFDRAVLDWVFGHHQTEDAASFFAGP